ncbi:MAG: flavodoxin family protein [Ruminococcaceae bacterium]|nr:flavodoxin family protein [Oscillospiraceae bacterium]
MQYCILMGSPRKQGNTVALLHPIIEELTAAGAGHTLFWLYDQHIEPCIACRACQADWTKFGCIQQDDGQMLFDAVLASDVILLATPIYAWYCTPPMKALLDRLIYGMNKYYGGGERGPALWAGKKVALLTTAGQRPEKGTDLWEEGMKRYCKAGQMEYLGMHAERHLSYNIPFMDDEKAQRARNFARTVLLAPT